MECKHKTGGGGGGGGGGQTRCMVGVLGMTVYRGLFGGSGGKLEYILVPHMSKYVFFLGCEIIQS